jgi:hypothetical protein
MLILLAAVAAAASHPAHEVGAPLRLIFDVSTVSLRWLVFSLRDWILGVCLN